MNSRICAGLLLLVAPLCCLCVWSPKLLAPKEFLDYYIHGAGLSYYVNVDRCHHQIYSNITQYSYGDVITNGYVTAYPSGKFLLTYASDREVNGKHLNLSGPAIRSTGIGLDESPDVIVDMNDIDPSNGRVMDQSEVLCQNKGDNTGGFLLFAQTPKGDPVTTFTDVSSSLMSGEILYYVFDIYHCTPKESLDANQFFAGRIIDYRFNKQGHLVFSDHLLGLGFITVFNVAMTSQDDVTIDMYMYSRQTQESTHLANKTCKFGKSYELCDMDPHSLLILLCILFSGVTCAPKEIVPAETVKYLEDGGLLSYDLNVTRCVVSLPKQLPVFSWGDRVSDVITVDQGADNYAIEFSITRTVSGSRYNLTDRPVRFTQVTFMPSGVFVEITDVNEDVPSFLQTGSIQCDYTKKGVTLYGRSKPSNEITAYDDLVSHLRKGYDLNYVMTWDMCSPANSTTNMWWSGKITDYRFSHNGGVAFTQLVDSAQKTFYLQATVSKTGVTVKTFTVNRLMRKQSSTETRTCKMGHGYRVFVTQNA